MAHAHSHGAPDGTFFLDQLFTILLAAGLGLVAVLMYMTKMLDRILAPMFFVPVLIGGLAILAMTLIRAVAVWKLAGAHPVNAAGHTAHEHHEHDDCGHEHSHAADCGHDHGHAHAHAHAHGGHTPTNAGDPHDDHGHEHGWAPWKYLILAVPVFLYFLGLPRAGLSGVDRNRTLGTLQASPKREALSMFVGGPAFTKVLRKPEPQTYALRFKELTEAAAIPARHEVYEGDIGILRGQFIPLKSSDREFTLLRVDMTCCVADQVFLETRIVAPEPLQGIYPEQWVRVKGLISFQKNAKGKWIPVITLDSNDIIDTNVEPALNVNDP